ncbi:NAD(P)-dependent dehydrogenase (short-subunit alcohol dehydrogenase family) [Thermosporothrix hazakensis]|uniref:NAD(P)-dependent dehydrogenase (Short-subunit alcohol dehydrogenase family) n=2 Tax=Thermosporothrix TaxID=768650 RepID=A0A326UCA3_THEHA|nr:SDR family NAD(P)-dependent oxidoreductase [Thermosporothrix hazakensis]PZW31899.1 NAD(P)-dependent dehydrogenase (short-subunit alcohol dehydrogenase family) [Thermosporothrix hazakensis]
MSFEGKRVLITGAASGIGQASARLFAEEGAHLILLDRDEAGLHATGKTLPAETLLLTVDVADEQAVRAAVQEAGERIDVVINSAAILANWGAPHEIPEELWNEVFSINLKGVVYTCRHALPLMRAGSAIINMASVCGVTRACTNRAPYNIAKAGIVAFTRDLAATYGPRGIRANTLVPGFIDTPMSRRLVQGHEEQARAEEGRIPLRRLGQADEVARAAVFLASEAASYITGSTLFVDGGIALV